MLYEHQCFHALQAAEKSLKAVLLTHGIAPPRSHDLAFLLAQLPKSIMVPVELVGLPLLTKYAVQLRYPGVTAPITAIEYRTALELAREAVNWASSIVIKP